MLSLVLCRGSPSTLQASSGDLSPLFVIETRAAGPSTVVRSSSVEARCPRYRRLQATSVLCSLSGPERRVRQQSFVLLCRCLLSTLQASPSDLSPLFVRFVSPPAVASALVRRHVRSLQLRLAPPIRK
ncbi:hypothetical protein GN244_ATG00055 [Phytophthora infestans]|nr:hypothetical protein GN244_ATG00055 [Phytophthora infestans]KAF4129135.1 hypothetical protein GN958_ATG21690 [Phytophthora infestans]